MEREIGRSATVIGNDRGELDQHLPLSIITTVQTDALGYCELGQMIWPLRKLKIPPLSYRLH